MATKKKAKDLFVAYVAGDPCDPFMGTLRECEEVAADWYRDNWVEGDVVIGKVVPQKSVTVDRTPSALPWKQL